MAAVSARDQQASTNKVVAKFERTAQAVGTLLVDLQMGIEEGEPSLCHEIFQKVAQWVRGMKDDTLQAQHEYA